MSAWAWVLLGWLSGSIAAGFALALIGRHMRLQDQRWAPTEPDVIGTAMNSAAPGEPLRVRLGPLPAHGSPEYLEDVEEQTRRLAIDYSRHTGGAPLPVSDEVAAERERRAELRRRGVDPSEWGSW